MFDLSHVAVPIFALDLISGNIRALNNFARQLANQDEVSLVEIVGNVEAEKWFSLARRARRSQLTLGFESRFSWSHSVSKQSHQMHNDIDNGAALNIDSRLFKISMSGPKDVNHIILTLTDISQQVELAKSARRSFEFLQSLLNLTSSLFFVIDLDGWITFSNAAFDQHCIGSRGQNHSKVSKTEDIRLTRQHFPHIEETFYDAVEACFSSNEPHKIQLEWPSQDGQRHVFQMLLQPLVRNRQAEQILMIGSDITALISAYEEQDSLQHELVEAKRLEAVGQMAGTIAHDFNGFLTILFSSLSLLEQEGLAQGQTELFVGMRRVCDQARDLTRNLLTFSQIQNHKVTSSNFQANLTKIDAHLRFALPHLGNPHVEVRYSSNITEEPLLELSETQCSQLVINLVKNAVEAIPDDREGEVLVHCVTEAAKVMITVSDNGIGISPSQQKQIFDPFFTTKRALGGTGLGLASARSLVLQAGGELKLKSAIDEGTTFEIILPIALS